MKDAHPTTNSRIFRKKTLNLKQYEELPKSYHHAVCYSVCN